MAQTAHTYCTSMGLEAVIPLVESAPACRAHLPERELGDRLFTGDLISSRGWQVATVVPNPTT